MKNKELNVLLVEDNEGDILLTHEAFSEAGIKNQMNVARDGQQAIDYLERCKIQHCNPDLVLLDINLPKINGLQVLKHIKRDSILRKTIVVMLSTSASDKDISSCYSEYANCYITKPSNIDRFILILKGIKEYWLNIAQMPLVN